MKTNQLKMADVKYIFWKEDNIWIGYIERFSDYWTQGESEDELEENLRDLYKELTSGNLPTPRQSGILKIA